MVVGWGNGGLLSSCWLMELQWFKVVVMSEHGGGRQSSAEEIGKADRKSVGE